jgi:hypothetical protein
VAEVSGSLRLLTLTVLDVLLDSVKKWWWKRPLESLVKYFFLELADLVTLFVDRAGVPVVAPLEPFVLEEDDVMVVNGDMMMVIIVVMPSLAIPGVARTAVAVVVVDTMVVVPHLVHGVVKDRDEAPVLDEELVEEIIERSTVLLLWLEEEIGKLMVLLLVAKLVSSGILEEELVEKVGFVDQMPVLVQPGFAVPLHVLVLFGLIAGGVSGCSRSGCLRNSLAMSPTPNLHTRDLVNTKFGKVWYNCKDRAGLISSTKDQQIVSGELLTDVVISLNLRAFRHALDDTADGITLETFACDNVHIELVVFWVLGETMRIEGTRGPMGLLIRLSRWSLDLFRSSGVRRLSGS